MTHEVFKVETIKKTDNEGIEHEFIFGLLINYGLDKSIEHFDTQYWMHFSHDPVYGLVKKGEGTDIHSMPDFGHAQEVFISLTRILETENWENRKC